MRLEDNQIMRNKIVYYIVLILSVVSFAVLGVVAYTNGLFGNNLDLQSTDGAHIQTSAAGYLDKPDLPPPENSPTDPAHWTGYEPPVPTINRPAEESAELPQEEPEKVPGVDDYFPRSSESDKRVILVCTKDADGGWAVTSSYHLSSGLWIVLILVMAVILNAGLIFLAAALIDRARRQ